MPYPIEEGGGSLHLLRICGKHKTFTGGENKEENIDLNR